MKIITKVLIVFVFLCASVWNFALDWNNPILQHNNVYTPSSTYTPYISTSSYRSNGIYLTSQHINTGNYSNNQICNQTTNFNIKYSAIPQISYSKGTFNTTYISNPSYPSLNRNEFMQVYDGDIPGLILGNENKVNDNPVVTASSWLTDTCSNCGKLVYIHPGGKGYYDDSNGSHPHICIPKPSPSPIGAGTILIVFCIIYYLLKKRG